jgi:hypothetical protein
MHDTITVGIPVLAILFGILFNQRGLDKLEGRVDSRFDRLEKRMDTMQSDLSRSTRFSASTVARSRCYKRNSRATSTHRAGGHGNGERWTPCWSVRSA